MRDTTWQCWTLNPSSKSVAIITGKTLFVVYLLFLWLVVCCLVVSMECCLLSACYFYGMLFIAWLFLWNVVYYLLVISIVCGLLPDCFYGMLFIICLLFLWFVVCCLVVVSIVCCLLSGCCQTVQFSGHVVSWLVAQSRRGCRAWNSKIRNGHNVSKNEQETCIYSCVHIFIFLILKV